MILCMKHDNGSMQGYKKSNKPVPQDKYGPPHIHVNLQKTFHLLVVQLPACEKFY